MKFDLTSPCASCPFRTDCVSGWLGRVRAADIAESLERKSFPCHKTIDYEQIEAALDESDDGDNPKRPYNASEQHCAGALIMREHMQAEGDMAQIAGRLGLYDHTKLKMDAPVFKDDQEFIDHHDYKNYGKDDV